MHPKLKTWLLILSIPVTYALILRFVFDLNIFRHFITVMSISFFISVPFGVGYLTIGLSNIEKVKKKSYRIFMPWIPIGIFLFLTLTLAIEGWACWLMILPIFLILSSLGGLTAGYYKIRKYNRSQNLNLSLILLLPFLAVPLEKLLPHTSSPFRADTFIDIHAPGEKIWSNVVRVRAIDAQDDKGSVTNWLGFPRPIKAELDYAGVGGRRQAIFSKGLIFEEIVQDYQPEKRMHFSIRADPYAIPSATMDKHVVIGGDYFDVLDGTYELEKLQEGSYRLHLYSHFTLKTTFNFYAGWWAGLIMKDIQNNILQVIRTRSQQGL